MNYKRIIKLQEVMMFLLIPIVIVLKHNKLLWFIFLLNACSIIVLNFYLLIKNKQYELLKKEFLFGILFIIFFYFILYELLNNCFIFKKRVKKFNIIIINCLI